MKTLGTLILAVALFTSGAHAANWYVAVGGTGDGSSPATPAGDLAAVINGAAGGDTIHLNGGDQFGYPANTLTIAVPLTLKSYGTGQAIISNTTHVAGQLLALDVGAYGSVLDNLSFAFMDYGGGQNYVTVRLLNNAHRITIKNCTFDHVDSPGGIWSGEPFIYGA